MAEGMPKHGEFCWTEIATNDLPQAKNFYSNVFGWNFKQGSTDEMEYPEFSVGDEYPMGGMYAITKEMCGENLPPPHFMSYISVDNVDDSTNKAKELGGSVIKEPSEIPNVGRFSIVQDPTGGVVALITLAEGGM
jgi:uncharacterized protein